MSFGTDSVTVRFGDVTALDDVSIGLTPGEVTAVVGADGAGRTGLMRVLAGLVDPVSGSVHTPGASRIGYLPSLAGSWKNLTVAENVAFVGAAYGLSGADLAKSADPILERAGLAHVTDRLAEQLSGGMHKKLGVALALLHSPDLLILDEPTTGVGALGAAHLWDQIRKEAERGVGVLDTTHSMQEARQCDSLVLLSEGAVVGHGTESQIVGGLTAIEVTTDLWSDAFNALTAPDTLVTLNGRSVRIIDQSRDEVERALHDAGIAATLETLPATIDERMASLASAAGGH